MGVGAGEGEQGDFVRMSSVGLGRFHANVIGRFSEISCERHRGVWGGCTRVWGELGGECHRRVSLGSLGNLNESSGSASVERNVIEALWGFGILSTPSGNREVNVIGGFWEDPRGVWGDFVRMPSRCLGRFRANAIEVFGEGEQGDFVRMSSVGLGRFHANVIGRFSEISCERHRGVWGGCTRVWGELGGECHRRVSLGSLGNLNESSGSASVERNVIEALWGFGILSTPSGNREVNVIGGFWEDPRGVWGDFVRMPSRCLGRFRANAIEVFGEGEQGDFVRMSSVGLGRFHANVIGRFSEISCERHRGVWGGCTRVWGELGGECHRRVSLGSLGNLNESSGSASVERNVIEALWG